MPTWGLNVRGKRPFRITRPNAGGLRSAIPLSPGCVDVFEFVDFSICFDASMVPKAPQQQLAVDESSELAMSLMKFAKTELEVIWDEQAFAQTFARAALGGVSLVASSSLRFEPEWHQSGLRAPEVHLRFARRDAPGCVPDHRADSWSDSHERDRIFAPNPWKELGVP